MGKFRKVLAILTLSTLAVGCSSGTASTDTVEAINLNNLSLSEIETQAKAEGFISSVGMPDSWANWGETWQDIENIYGIGHSDTDMSSAEEIAKMEAEKNNPTVDIGDVGISFGPVALNRGVTQPYKTSYWNDIPDWAKDDEGHWIVGYTGTMAIITDKTKVDDLPKTWDDLKNGDYKISPGDVTTATQSQNAVLSAAYAYGGDETNLQPGIDFFAEIAKEGRLSLGEVNIANLEKGEIEVAFLWDFNALNYKDQIDPDRFDVTILDEAAVISGYATIINKYAPNPHAAALAREYILSDEGQINLARGYAKPIRDVELPADVADKLLDSSEYVNVIPVNDFDAWEASAAELPSKWQQEVLLYAY
ncbi:MAG: ABC transporter substrate-binding protein [Epulopiscium sp. Nele67-Bin004]|nr:MAG: ABC transporter substrate-binding protein [Epulopiscium sp. Nele67-Bin004]